MTGFLHIKDLTVSFRTGKGNLKVVDHLSLVCQKGETFTILGESGCGKSVVARAIMGILDETARVKGQIFFNGLDLQKINEKEMEKIRGNRISIIMQNPDLALNPVIRIGNQLIESLLIHTRTTHDLARSQVNRMLKRMGFDDIFTLLKLYPHQLSGGMKQRLLITAALLTRPDIIIADEPTKGLDEINRELVITELRKVKKKTRCNLILITHDIQLASQITDRIAVMYAGELVEISGVNTFFKKPLHPYTKALLKSSPEQGFHLLAGQSPSLDQLPKGCRFHPRCQQKRKLCSQKRPEMVQSDGAKVKCILYYSA